MLATDRRLSPRTTARSGRWSPWSSTRWLPGLVRMHRAEQDQLPLLVHPRQRRRRDRRPGGIAAGARPSTKEEEPNHDRENRPPRHAGQTSPSWRWSRPPSPPTPRRSPDAPFPRETCPPATPNARAERGHQHGERDREDVRGGSDKVLRTNKLMLKPDDADFGCVGQPVPGFAIVVRVLGPERDHVHAGIHQRTDRDCRAGPVRVRHTAGTSPNRPPGVTASGTQEETMTLIRIALVLALALVATAAVEAAPVTSAPLPCSTWPPSRRKWPVPRSTAARGRSA